LGIVHDKKIKKFIIYPSSVNNSFINRNHFIKSNNIKNIDTITFDELCSKYNINNIKKLSIDCEGYDYSLINSIDFLKYKIEEINCEIWPHDYDSTTEIPTGPYFFENTLKPKILQFYTISDYEIDGMPSYKFELKV
jgi:hypothetical protein